MIEYIVKIYSYGIPLKKSINKENIQSFILLYKSPSDFSSWCTTNIKALSNIKNGLPSDYFDDDVDNMMEKNVLIEDIYLPGDHVNKKINNIHINNNILFNEMPVVFGGIKPINYTYIKHDYTNINIVQFCWSILFYLFSPTIIDFDVLPKPKQLFIDSQIGGNGVMHETLMNLSNDKGNERLVYLIKIVNGESYCIKITPPKERYNTEINIYNELTDASKGDNILNRQLVKICSNGTLKRGNKQIKFTEGDWNVIPSISQEIDLFIGKTGTDVIYYVTEYDTRYTPLENLIKTIDEDQLCIMIKNIIKLLNY
jgi:hypothetical protein